MFDYDDYFKAEDLKRWLLQTKSL